MGMSLDNLEVGLDYGLVDHGAYLADTAAVSLCRLTVLDNSGYFITCRLVSGSDKVIE